MHKGYITIAIIFIADTVLPGLSPLIASEGTCVANVIGEINLNFCPSASEAAQQTLVQHEPKKTQYLHTGDPQNGHQSASPCPNLDALVHGRGSQLDTL